MEKGTIHYTKGDLTVVWQPDRCFHCSNCWKGLKVVFDPWKKPWVNMDGADEQQIIDQVNLCPSGALSYIKKDKES